MERLNNNIHKFVSILIIIISIIGASNAILRYLGKYLHLNLSSNALIELQWYMFSVIFLLGASYTFLKDKHIRVDVFYNSYSERNKAIFNLLGTLLLLIPFCSIMTYLSWGYFYTSFSILEQSSDPNGLPRYIVKFFIPASFFLLLINSFYYVVDLVKKIRTT